MTTGTILGTIQDNTGAAVGGAKIVITDPSKGTSQTYTSDETGAYNAPFLIPGTYSVSIEMPAFKRQVREGVVLQVDQKARIDFTLEVGQVTETISVTAAAPLVRSDSARNSAR